MGGDVEKCSDYERKHAKVEEGRDGGGRCQKVLGLRTKRREFNTKEKKFDEIGEFRIFFTKKATFGNGRTDAIY